MVLLLFLLTPLWRRFALRTGGGLLCFQWALGHHVRYALAEVALFGLGRQFALFGMVVQTSTVVAPGETMNREERGEARG